MSPLPQRKSRGSRRAGALLLVLALAGCASTAVEDDSVDPGIKLGQAAELFEQQSRPLRAEQLIRQAITTYRQREDAQGLAHAYRVYGELLRSSAVGKQHADFYRTNGFLDRTITFDNRLERADAFFRDALDEFKRAVDQRRRQNRLDQLPNVYVNEAMTHLALRETPQACQALDRASQAVAEAVKAPDARKTLPEPQAVIAKIAAQKQQLKCPD